MAGQPARAAQRDRAGSPLRHEPPDRTRRSSRPDQHGPARGTRKNDGHDAPGRTDLARATRSRAYPARPRKHRNARSSRANPRHRPQHALSQAQEPWPVTPGANALIWVDPVFPALEIDWSARLLNRGLARRTRAVSIPCGMHDRTGRQPLHRLWPRDVNLAQIGFLLALWILARRLLYIERGIEWGHVQNATNEVDARFSAPPGHPYWPGTVGDCHVLRAGWQHRCDPA